MFLRYSSILFGIAPSALITFGTTFTLSIFHNSHSRSTNINSVSFMFVSHSQWFLRNAIPESLWQHRPKGSEPLGTRITFFCCCCFYYYYYNTLFFAHAQCVSPLCFGESFAWNFCTTSVASNPCTQIISSLRDLFKFQATLFDFIILFCVLAFTVFILWERYLDREVRKTILVRHIHVCISITWYKVTDVLITFRYFTFSK